MRAAVHIAKNVVSLPVEDRVDADPFRLLYLTHLQAVRSVLFRLGVGDELDDMAQEVFLRVCSTWGSFRGAAAPRTWIIRIAINLAKDQRKKRRIETTDENPELVGPAPTRDPVASDAIERALARLSDDARNVFVLCVIEEYKMAEAAAILAVPEGTVKSRLFNAKRDVRSMLESEGFLR